MLKNNYKNKNNIQDNYGLYGLKIYHRNNSAMKK